jgi:hypothetical protein
VTRKETCRAVRTFIDFTTVAINAYRPLLLGQTNAADF